MSILRFFRRWRKPKVELDELTPPGRTTSDLDCLFEERMRNATSRRLLATYMASYIEQRHTRDPLLQRAALLLRAFGEETP